MKSYKFIISGGGTGGHIFPAIAIADALKKKSPGSDFLFIGAKDRMEMEKVPKSGYKIEGLWISGLQRELTFKNLSFPFKLISSILKAKRLIRKFRPDVVIGVGGYSSGPVVYAAHRLGIPTLIQEQNSFPGITNKLLKNKVDKICVAYNGLERFFPKEKIILTGNPVRKEVVDINGKKQEAMTFFGLDKSLKTILIIGGSLGAKTLNLSIGGGVKKFINEKIQLIWQTGTSGIDQARQVIALHNSDSIKAFDFISRMNLAYAAADLVIARAGAITVSELCLVSKPSILVPSPNVAEDHQTKNAIELHNENAAILVKDGDAANKLCDVAINLVKNDANMLTLATNMKNFAITNAADKISDTVLKLIDE